MFVSELGAIYVKKLFYAGINSGNIANVKIWFGSKQLHVTELLSALSQTIGIDADTFSELDLEQLVKASEVKRLCSCKVGAPLPKSHDFYVLPHQKCQVKKSQMDIIFFFRYI